MNQELDHDSARQMYRYILEQSTKSQEAHRFYRAQFDRLGDLMTTVQDHIYIEHDHSMKKYMHILEKEHKQFIRSNEGYIWYKRTISTLLQTIHDELDFDRLGLVTETEKTLLMERFSGMLKSSATKKPSAFGQFLGKWFYGDLAHLKLPF